MKKLIATCYDGSPIVGSQLNLFDFLDGEKTENSKTAFKVEINEVIDANGDGAIDLFDIQKILNSGKNKINKLTGNGDFRSQECINLLKEADVVVTNPPFSLFREYVSQLFEYDKKFIIIGNTNALTYKEIFGLFQKNAIRTGYTNFNVGMFFMVPDNFSSYTEMRDGKKYARVSTSCWFTNFPVTKHKEFLTMYKKFNPESYPKYENYDAINVDTFKDIPDDYFDCIGVPITFLDKYNPEQFEIVRFRKGSDNKDLTYIKNGKKVQPYFRIIIKRRKR